MTHKPDPRDLLNFILRIHALESRINNIAKNTQSSRMVEFNCPPKETSYCSIIKYKRLFRENWVYKCSKVC